MNLAFFGLCLKNLPQSGLDTAASLDETPRDKRMTRPLGRQETLHAQYRQGALSCVPQAI